eukprot:TRINITY_DN8701_c0_g2_i1.p1 TRINITY_DN8701_c0_g2~~TRINITY_DN8701_c0_g2_i1.p1  ORF type:complete len:567 (-),score=164.83 TRINITY_DN8701_c0_g2_i1:159-1859(-)
MSSLEKPKKKKQGGNSLVNNLGTNKIGKEAGEGLEEDRPSSSSASSAARNGGGSGDGVVVLKELLLDMKTQLAEVAEGQRRLQEALRSGAPAAALVATSSPSAVNGKAAALSSGAGALKGIVEEGAPLLSTPSGVSLCKPPPVSAVADKRGALLQAIRATMSTGAVARKALKDRQSMEISLDSVMGFVIIVNAVYIGFAMDQEDGSAGWVAMNTMFTIVYVLELMVKIFYLRGFMGFYFGPDGFSAKFDTFLVCIDLLQLFLNAAAPDVAESMESAPSASMFRILRLVKLARLLRLLRADVFADLLMMIQGMIGGTGTLFWAMVLFFIVMYVVSLLHREFYGRRRIENIYEYFDTVPRSLLTTYRCGFGDCSTAGGTPIFEFIHIKYGWLATIFYLLFVFSIAVGLFNVISAIFVESTMAAAQKIMHQKKKERLADTALWSSNVAILVKRMIDLNHGMDVPEKLSASIDEIVNFNVPCHVIEELVKDEEAMEALEDLGIDPEDNPLLSDIFDPDNGGEVTVEDLVDGIRKLRGDPRRSDIVTVDLMIRSIQGEVHEILQRLRAADG